MNKTKTILICALLAFLMSAIYSCKKDETGNNAGPADNYVGRWSGRDTVYKPTGEYIQSGVIDFTVVKKDANNVYLTDFLLETDTVVMAATNTSLTYVSGASGSLEQWYPTLVLTLSDGKIYYINDLTGSGGNVIKGTATKQ